MKNFRFIFYLICLGIIINSCKQDELEQEDQNNTPTGLVKVNANIVLPEGVMLTNPEGYKISTSDGDFKINPEYKIALKTITPGSTVYSCISEVKTTGGNQIIFLTNQIGTPILYGYNTLPTMQDLQTFKGIYLSAESTAIATLLSYPQFISPYKDVQDVLSKEIVKMPSYASYLNEVIAKIKEVSKIPACTSVDYTALPFYKVVIGEFLNSAVAENYMIMKSNVEYSHISETNGIFKFKVINKGMRTVDIYANKVYLNNNVPYNKMQIEVSEQDEEPSLEGVLLKSKPINYKTLVFGSLKSYLFGGNYPDYIAMSETKLMTANVQDAQRLELEVWGIGQPHKPLSDFSDPEVFRLCQVAMEAGYNDFINPVISLNEGVNMKITEVQNTNNVFDFRYGSRKQPFRELIKKLTQAYLAQSNINLKLFNYFTNKEYAELIQDMGVFIAKELFTDFETGGNKPKYLNYIYNMYKNTAGITKTDDQFRASFKKCYASLWHWYDLAEKTVKISTASVTLAAAIHDAYSSKTMVTFTKNISSVPDAPTLKDNLNYIYKVVKLDNKWWSAENWRESGGGAYYYNNDKMYGAYFLGSESGGVINMFMDSQSLSQGWRLPSSSEYQSLINSLGNNAFTILTDQLGFNAKPYGYNQFSTQSTPNNNISEFSNSAYYLTSTKSNLPPGQSGGGYTDVLVINYTNHTVTIQTILYGFAFGYSGSIGNYFNARLVKD